MASAYSPGDSLYWDFLFISDCGVLGGGPSIGPSFLLLCSVWGGPGVLGYQVVSARSWTVLVFS